MVERILVVDDQEEVRDLLAGILERRGSEPVMASCAEDALDMLGKDAEDIDLVILDYDFGPKMNGLEALPEIKKIRSDLPVIILTGKGSIPLKVQAMKMGADHFVEKDFYMEENIETSLRGIDNLINLVRKSNKLRREAEYYRKALNQHYSVVGDSPPVRKMLDQAREVASGQYPVLIRGERGTGKELVAVTIHRSSAVREGPFITINCAQTEKLLERELFGQGENLPTRTAFGEGCIMLAGEGTLFLDEIGAMPIEIQRKILRFLDYQQSQRVGREKAINVNVRIIAATDADLEKDMGTGRFCTDLYARLAFETIWVPALRERKADIELLCYHFTERLAEEIPGVKAKKLSSEALSAMMEYDWPGNVRELKYIIERLTYRTDVDTVHLQHLPEEIRLPALTEAATGESFSEKVDNFQKLLLRSALLRSDWDSERAAEHLGLENQMLQRLCAKYHLLDTKK